jgi:outer membrane protein TolC
LAQNSYDQGYLQQSDVLLVKVRVTEVKNQLQTARSNVKNASNYLSFLMNDTSDVVLKPQDTLQLEATILESENGLSEERADIKAMQLAANARETMYKSDKMTFLPTLNAFGSYQLYDDSLFQFGADGYLIGARTKMEHTTRH